MKVRYLTAKFLLSISITIANRTITSEMTILKQWARVSCMVFGSVKLYSNFTSLYYLQMSVNEGNLVQSNDPDYIVECFIVMVENFCCNLGLHFLLLKFFSKRSGITLRYNTNPKNNNHILSISGLILMYALLWIYFPVR